MEDFEFGEIIPYQGLKSGKKRGDRGGKKMNQEGSLVDTGGIF